MRKGILVSVVLLAALLLPIWLMQPSPEANWSYTDDQQELDRIVRDYQDYPFHYLVGTWVSAASMRSWHEDVYGQGERRLGATSAAELPGLLDHAGRNFHEAVLKMLLVPIPALIWGWLWSLAGLAILRWKADQEGPYAYKGTLLIVAIALGGYAAPVLAPVVFSEGAELSWVLSLPLVIGWVVAAVVRKRAKRQGDSGATRSPGQPA